MTIFKVNVNQNDPRELGAFLVKNGFSKKAVNNAKNHGGMLLVNHHRRYTNYHLHQGDEVLFISGTEPVNQWLKPSKQPLAIVKETANYLVINKPAGLLSIPSRYDNQAVVNRVLGYFVQQKLFGVKPHVVTRLDRDTSGLVLIGKNAIAHARFSQLSKENFVKKYHAIVHGNFTPAEEIGEVNAPIGRKKNAVKREIDSQGQIARTAYQVLKQVPGASLVELRLYTGRTHQIRVHMQAIGHPLYGDPLYGMPDDFQRQALNCCYLAFPDPFTTGQTVKVAITEPDDMKMLWQKIAKTNF